MPYASPDTPRASSADRHHVDWTPRPRALGGNVFAAGPYDMPARRVFGGRLLAEALVSAGMTVPQRFRPHALSAQFLRPAERTRALRYEVENLRDGNSFASRGVKAVQDGVTVAAMMVSLADTPSSPQKGAAMPDVSGPDALPSTAACREILQTSNPRLAHVLWWREHPIEVRPTDIAALTSGATRDIAFWFRASPALTEDDPLLRAGLLAYASDRFVMASTLLSRLDELENNDFTLATVSHSLWLHRDYPPDSWVLCHVQHRSLANARAFVRSEMFSADGSHLASMGQDGLVTPRPIPISN